MHNEYDQEKTAKQKKRILLANQTKNRLSFLEWTTWKQKKRGLSVQKKVEHLNIFLFFLRLLAICLDMEQSVLVPASKWNN